MQAARGAGNASKVKQPAIAAAVTQAQLRLRVRPSESSRSNCANARVTLGSNSAPGFSLARWSSTQRFRFTLLFLSISLDVLLPERLLGATEKCPNRNGIQIEGVCQLIVAEAVAA